MTLQDEIEFLECPRRHGGLTNQAEPGSLACTACGTRYPIVNGVVRFVDREHYAGSFGFQWNAHRRTQLDSYMGIPLSRDRLFQVSGWPEYFSGQTILEAGSGAGRFTEVLVMELAARVLSFDLVDGGRSELLNNGHRPNLMVMQADMTAIPVRPRSIDKVLCLGVLQHTPDPALRHLTHHVRPGGEL